MTGRVGRPSTGVRVDIRIPAELLEEIDGWAERHELTRAELVRQLLEQGMNDQST